MPSCCCGQVLICCPGNVPNTLFLDLSGGTGCLSTANETGITLVWNPVDSAWEDNPPSDNILAPFSLTCSNISELFELTYTCPLGPGGNIASITSEDCGPPLSFVFDLGIASGQTSCCTTPPGDITGTVHT